MIGGRLPLLEDFQVYQEDITVRDLDAAADMLEARVQIPGCKKFSTFEAGRKWINRASPGTQIRLLRVLLPSLKELALFNWDATYDPCFCDVHPPQFEALHVAIVNSGPSCEVLEAIPKLKTVDYIFGYHNVLGAVPFQPVITALQRGIGLRELREMKLTFCELGDLKFSEFLQNLEGSGCVERMVVLSFSRCWIGVAGMHAWRTCSGGTGFLLWRNCV